MKELLDQRQESGFPNKEEIHTAPKTTFKKLGIEDLREKRLSLDNEQFTVLAIKDYQNSWTFLVPFNHPLVGAHLAHFLNAEAPIKVDPYVAKNAILADFDMPLNARRTIKPWKPPRTDALAYKRYVDLDNLHVGDPEIKLHYKEFVEQGLEQETNALKNSKYDNLFNQAMQLNVINLQAVEPVFFDLLAKFKSDKLLGKTSAEIFFSLYAFPIERRYSQFLRLQPEYKFDYPGFDNQVRQLIPKFLEQLDSVGQRDIMIANTIQSPNATVIDLSTKEIFGKYDGVDLSFSDHSIDVADNNGNSIQIEFQQDSQALYFPYRTVRYKFPEEPLQNALYAVIAWNKTSDGQRRFLSQNELLGFLSHLNFDRSKRPDVYLGRNLLGYFSPDITDKWPSEIALEGHPRPQKMMGAQVSVRDSLDSDKYPHARQLLRGSVIQKLEKHALAS